MELQNKGQKGKALSSAPDVPLLPPPPPHFLPPPPPPPVFNLKSKDSLPEFLQGYPFDLQMVAPKKSCPELGIDVMMKYGPQAEFRFSIELEMTSYIQLGPTCGITAALMLTHVQDDKENLFSETNRLVLQARAMGFTTYGEMFNTYHLSQLIQKKLNLSTRILDNWRDSLPTVMEHLLSYKPIMVPYDYSPQITEPAYQQGYNAHWAVLVGFCYNFYPFPNTQETDYQTASSDDYVSKMRTLQSRFLDGKLSAKAVSSFILNHNFRPENLHFYGRHSRTNKVCIWNCNDLWKSNRLLSNVREKYMAPGVGFIVPPDGDLSQTLACRMILVDKLLKPR